MLLLLLPTLPRCHTPQALYAPEYGRIIAVYGIMFIFLMPRQIFSDDAAPRATCYVIRYAAMPPCAKARHDMMMPLIYAAADI